MPDTGNPSERLADLRARWEADRRSRIFLQLAEEYRRQGQPLEALAVLDEGLDRHPSSVAGKVLQGRCRLESGQAEAAAATLEEVVARDPTHIVAYRWLTESYLELGDAEQARRRLEVYTQLNPQGEDLQDLSRRLVALEDPARRLSVGPGPAAGVTPLPRPSAEVTEAPTMLMSVPAGLRDSGLRETEQPTVAAPHADLPSAGAPGEAAAPEAPASATDSPTEAPTRAIPLADVEHAAAETSSRDEGTASETTAAEVTGEGVPPRHDSERDDRQRLEPAHSEAPTAKLRLASLGLVPNEAPAAAAPVDSKEASAPAKGPPESEPVTAEIPWWRARPAPKPAPSPWDTQEAEARPVTDAGGDLRALHEQPSEEQREERDLLSSEAPTGVFDASSLLQPPASAGDDDDRAVSEAETATVQLAGLDALRHGEEVEEHAEQDASELARPRDRGMIAEPFEAAASSETRSVGSEESDLFDLVGGDQAGGAELPPPLRSFDRAPSDQAPDGASRLSGEPRADDIFELSAHDRDRQATADGGQPTAARAPSSDPFPELYAPTDSSAGPSEEELAASRPADSASARLRGNGSAVLFALDPSDLLEDINLASIPTRPLSIPFWLAHPASAGRSSRSGGPATPTLAHLYLQQGHAAEAETIYGTILEREPENETARDGLAKVERVRADLSAAALIGDYEPERGGLTAKQVYVLQRYLARLKGERGHADVP